MNPDYILNNVPDKDSRIFPYRSMTVNKDAYLELKSLNYYKKWDKIYKPDDLNKPLKKVYHSCNIQILHE